MEKSQRMQDNELTSKIIECAIKVHKTLEEVKFDCGYRIDLLIEKKVIV